MHVWAQPPMHFYQADTCGRQRWPYVPAAGWHCASAESQLHSIHSALVFTLFAHKARWMVLVTTQDCPLHPLQNMFGRVLQSVTVNNNFSQLSCEKLLLNVICKDNFMHFLFICSHIISFAALLPSFCLFFQLSLSPLSRDWYKSRKKQRSCQSKHQARTPTRLHH